MVSRRLRIPCPRCSRELHIRVEALGRRGACKHCGHRFRPRADAPSDADPESDSGSGSWPEPAGAPAPDPEELAEGFGLMVEALERELQSTWERLSARQAAVLGQLYGRVGGHPEPSQVPGSSCEILTVGDREIVPPASVPPDPGAEADPLWALFQNAQSFVNPSLSQVDDASVPGPAVPGAVVEGQLAAPARERDEAWAESERLRDEARTLRSELAECMAEIVRLSKSAEKLGGIAAERDLLQIERDALALEASEAHARLVELEFAVVEAESARDELRERWKTAQDEWKERGQVLIDENERKLAERQARFEAERQAQFEAGRQARHEQLEIQRGVEREARALRNKVRKLRDLYDATREERDGALRRVEALDQQRGRLAAWLDEAEAERREENRAHRAEVERLNAALEEALEEAESARAELARRADVPAGLASLNGRGAGAPGGG